MNSLELQRNAIIDAMGKVIPGDVPKEDTKWNMSPKQGCILPARLFHPSTRRTNCLFLKIMASGSVKNDIIELKNYKARK